jgi:hypothetical protein
MPSLSFPVRLLALALGAAIALGCGQTVPAGGVPATAAADGKPHTGGIEASDLIPADLDLVVRVDLGKVRKSLGVDSSNELMDKALEDAEPEGGLRNALSTAEVVWLGIRLADLEAGDRVTVVRSAEAQRDPDSLTWKKHESEYESVVRFDARMPPRRGGTAQILRVGKRDAVFITPVEQMSVARVLERGPDPRRGQPEARGLISLDYRARRLSPTLEMRFPSLASLISGVDRMSGIVNLVAGKLELDARIRCKHTTAAAKVLRFLETIREAGKHRQRYSELLGALELELAESTVSVRWPLPRESVARWLHEDKPEPAPVDNDSASESKNEQPRDEPSDEHGEEPKEE